MAQNKQKSRSKSKRRAHRENNFEDSYSTSNKTNDYSHMQRYKHSYFKYRDGESPSSSIHHEDHYHQKHRENKPRHQQVDHHGDYQAEHQKNGGRKSNLKARFSPDEQFPKVRDTRAHSPAQTYASILPGEHESLMDKERKKRELAAELQAQIALKEGEKKRLKENKKNNDYKYLYESIHSNPFGRMGSGAPIRDVEGHVVAHRLKMSDDVAASSFHQSFYKQKEDQSTNNDISSRRKSEIQNLDKEEIGIQFLEWNNQEQKRKEAKRNEWKQTLDEQSESLRKKKEEEKRKKLEDELQLEEKVKHDLQMINEEYERETGRKSQKHANFSVGKESSVNYLVQNKRKSQNQSHHSRDRSGSNDRMRDFKGLGIDDEDDNRSQHSRPHQENNHYGFREDYKRREGTLNKQLEFMKERKFQQEQEIKSTMDSLMQLQSDLDSKYRDRRADNNDFYSSLANENKTLLSSLRKDKRNSMNIGYSGTRSFSHLNNPNLTPYEQQYGAAPSNRYNPGIQHESVFINAEIPNHQNPTEALDDLLNSYNQNSGQPGSSDRFTLPVPKSSMEHHDDYDDQIINTEEGVEAEDNPEDALDKFVENIQEDSERAVQEVA